MKHDYSKLEEKVLSFFPKDMIFNWNNNQYKVLLSGKPTLKRGDPKTDCYIQAINLNNQESIELKISCKLKSINEFQENKISSERARYIFGEDWEEIIINTTSKIKDRFENQTLNYPEGFGRTKRGHVILGWKVDIASKPRKLSSKLELTDQEIRDHVYKGLEQSEDKKNAFVEGTEIKNSGIAEYILITTIDDLNTVDDVLNQMIDIDFYKVPDHYLIFTSLAYSIQTGKSESRNFGVRVEWEADIGNNKIVPNIKYDSPLKPPSRTRDMKALLESSLAKVPEHRKLYK